MLGLIAFFFIYVNRTDKDTRAVETKVALSAEELVDYIDSENMEELKLYIDKAIEIEGIVKEIAFKNNIYTLLLTSDNTERLVLCEMQNTETAKIKAIKQGTRVTIKGIYKGALVDAILLNCIFV